MSKNKKDRKVKKLKDDAVFGINFELEDNAADLFAEYLERVPLDAGKLREGRDPGAVGNQAPSSARAGSEGRETSIDLHGLSLAEAIYLVDSKIRELISSRGGAPVLSVKVITGKGLHSGADGSVLAREVHAHVRSAFRKDIVRIDDSPANVTIDGIPLRGYFTVVLKKQGA